MILRVARLNSVCEIMISKGTEINENRDYAFLQAGVDEFFPESRCKHDESMRLPLDVKQEPLQEFTLRKTRRWFHDQIAQRLLSWLRKRQI